MGEFSDPFAAFDEPAPASETPSESQSEPAPESRPEPVMDAAAAAESERRLEAAADEYVQLLPLIEAAQPVRGSVEVAKHLTGVDYAFDAWCRLMNDPALLKAYGVPRLAASTFVVNGADAVLTVTVANPADELACAHGLIGDH